MKLNKCICNFINDYKNHIWLHDYLYLGTDFLAHQNTSYINIPPDIQIIFFLFPHVNICCEYSLEVLMSTHNICFCGQIKYQHFLVEKAPYLELRIKKMFLVF